MGSKYRFSQKKDTRFRGYHVSIGEPSKFKPRKDTACEYKVHHNKDRDLKTKNSLNKTSVNVACFYI